jgi:endonuclease/exonuclease/phosphatase family metal-dependent hydrolase
MAPDVAVIQECARPAAENDHCLWFGDNPRQGLAVVSSEPYRLRALDQLARIPRYIIPVEVTGPANFLLLAVWSKGSQRHPYVEAVVRAVKRYRHLFTQPVVLMGDLNSNALWDAEHKADRSHSALVRLLSGLGLVSAYHTHNGEPHGSETKPTYYFQWKESRPCHIDYCFLPLAWAPRLHRVEVGSYEEWRAHSDHRPLLVDLSDAQKLYVSAESPA